MERKECGNIEGMSNDILHSSLESPSNADLDVIHNLQCSWMEDGGWRMEVCRTDQIIEDGFTL